MVVDMPPNAPNELGWPNGEGAVIGDGLKGDAGRVVACPAGAANDGAPKADVDPKPDIASDTPAKVYRVVVF